MSNIKLGDLCFTEITMVCLFALNPSLERTVSMRPNVCVSLMAHYSVAKMAS